MKIWLPGIPVLGHAIRLATLFFTSLFATASVSAEPVHTYQIEARTDTGELLMLGKLDLEFGAHHPRVATQAVNGNWVFTFVSPSFREFAAMADRTKDGREFISGFSGAISSGNRLKLNFNPIVLDDNLMFHGQFDAESYGDFFGELRWSDFGGGEYLGGFWARLINTMEAERRIY